MLGRHSSPEDSCGANRRKDFTTPAMVRAKRAVRGWGYGVVLGGILTVATVLPAEAQRADQVPDLIRIVQTVEPLSGPVGTTVLLHTENLPLNARTHLGVGARHVGFEALVEVNQGEWGEVTGTLEIPGWATWDRPVVLLVLNGQFAPIGRSKPFHVTNSDGVIQRTGRIDHVEGVCVDFRDQDDVVYSLEGPSLSELALGEEVVVEGTPLQTTACGPGTAIRVESVVSIHRVALESGLRR